MLFSSLHVTNVTNVTFVDPVCAPEVPFKGTFACTSSYSPEALSGAEFAFDGTVRSVASAPNAGAEQTNLDMRTVAFTVREWFLGGNGQAVTVVMFAPKQQAPPSYAPGTRLLVSGDAAIVQGEPRQAWPCGFTRYYDRQTATTWRRISN